MNLIKIDKNRLLCKFGKMVPLDYVPEPGENLIHAYIDGYLPMCFVSTIITQEEFNKMY
ncbi:hypothetical protein [Clostridium tyrobutyricum]|uniref:hypothetical protein n=1 Tax=Clostridium tyrobutyricum TaxID=1519 RepID=UPI0010C47546|nr:hypothetical protein [Clostridium tyrobutyricum]QCH27620.1 hypothetical protein EZN00_01218 [Clostridium tyrobutyricum]